LNALAKAVTQAGAIGKVPQALVRVVSIRTRSDRGDEAILFQRQIWNQIVELEHKSHFVAQEAEQIAMTVHLDAIHGDSSPIWLIQTAEEMQERALSAAGRAAECNSFTLSSLEVDTFENGDGALVVALPHILRAKDDGAVTFRQCGQACHSKRSASTARIRIA
jgi:hypothetical protein